MDLETGEIRGQNQRKRCQLKLKIKPIFTLSNGENHGKDVKTISLDILGGKNEVKARKGGGKGKKKLQMPCKRSKDSPDGIKVGDIAGKTFKMHKL